MVACMNVAKTTSHKKTLISLHGATQATANIPLKQAQRLNVRYKQQKASTKKVHWCQPILNLCNNCCKSGAECCCPIT